MNDPAAGFLCRREYPQKGEQTMLVKAKWNVKDAAGWHDAGEVFNTEDDLGDAVESLEKRAPEPEQTSVLTEENSPEQTEVQKNETKPRTASRRKKVSE